MYEITKQLIIYNMDFINWKHSIGNPLSPVRVSLLVIILGRLRGNPPRSRRLTREELLGMK